MKSRLKYLALGVALGFASSAAVAFQESKGGSAGAEPQKAPLDLTGTGTSIDNSPPAGLEVRIPGLGKLGVLPKFDFGLELLYGVNDAKTPEADKLRPDQTDDARIRGSLKHRF
jgi:hypothetical protein